MSNRSAQHKHGLHDISGRRPKSRLWKRANKLKARAKKADALKEWQAIFKETKVKAPANKEAAAKKSEVIVEEVAA